jgi:hypothetical protein
MTKKTEIKVGDVVRLRWDYLLESNQVLGMVINVYETKTGIEYYKIIWHTRKKFLAPIYLTADELLVIK